MRNSKATRLDWYMKLWSIDGLARDIEHLLRHHEAHDVSRLAGEYWLQRAGLLQDEFLRMWDRGDFDA